MARLTYKQLQEMPASDIGKLSKSDAEALLSQFREKFEMRQRAFRRAGKNVYSPALEKMNVYYDGKVQSTENMSLNKMREELFRIQEFFNSRTGTVKGAREVMREQDIRIFGKTEKGNPRYRMTIEERTQFWATYEEFMKSNPRYDNAFMSGKIQQYLGEIAVDDRKSKGVFKKGDIGLIMRLNKLQSMAKERNPEYGRFGYNVLSGRGNTK